MMMKVADLSTGIYTSLIKFPFTFENNFVVDALRALSTVSPLWLLQIKS